MKPYTKKQLIKHIEQGNQSVAIMTLSQEEIIKAREDFIGASGAGLIYLKGEGCYNPLYEYFCSYTNYKKFEITEETYGNFNRGHMLEPLIADHYQYGLAINQKYNQDGQLIYFEIQQFGLNERIKKKQEVRKIFNYKNTLLKNLDPDKTDTILGATIDRLILLNDSELKGALEIKSKNVLYFRTEDGRQLPNIDIKNRDNITLQYLIQCQVQIYICDLDYIDLEISCLSLTVIHRIYKDQELIDRLKIDFCKFWQDVKDCKLIISQLRLLEEVSNSDTYELDYSQEDQLIISGQVFKLHQEIQVYIDKYLHKEFMSDSEYKSYLKMVYVPSDLLDMTEHIKTLEEGLIQELLIDVRIALEESVLVLKDRDSEVKRLLEKKKELSYVRKELDSVDNQIKTLLGSFTSVSGVLESGYTGNLLTYRPTKTGGRTLLIK